MFSGTGYHSEFGPHTFSGDFHGGYLTFVEVFPRQNFVPPKTVSLAPPVRRSARLGSTHSPRDINAAAAQKIKLDAPSPRGSIVVPKSPRKGSPALESGSVAQMSSYELLRAQVTGVGGFVMKIQYSTIPDSGLSWIEEVELK